MINVTLVGRCTRGVTIVAVATPRRCGFSRDLTKLRWRRQGERQKAIGLMSKTTTLHVQHVSVHYFTVSAQL